MSKKSGAQREMDALLETLDAEGRVPRLLLHSCCAPCSSYVLEYLSRHFSITVFYYNPNIYPDEEYRKRVEEQKDFLRRFPAANPVSFREGNYCPEDFYRAAKGMEQLPEGGERCFACYELRLREAAALAGAEGFDWFTTTLSISPYKNAGKLNEIGRQLEEELGVRYLCADFKKKGGYLRSIRLSEEYGLYRQDYCGCVFSMRERESAKPEGDGKDGDCHESAES